MKTFFDKDELSAVEAKSEAQRIAFGPIMFEATKALRDLGILQTIDMSGNEGISMSDIICKTGLPVYGVKVLLEAGLGIGVVILQADKYHLTKIGYFILHDEMTRVNMDFTHDVNYLGMYDLQKSIINGKPEGLKVFGQWDTVYQALSSLPDQARKSWFNFDHFYSDHAFAHCLRILFDAPDRQIKNLLDIGGNTGKWALNCVEYNQEVTVTIADLPGQLKMAEENITSKALNHRIKTIETNMLDPRGVIKNKYDAIWMSQFLDCFSTSQIIDILLKCVTALEEDGLIFILETYWDRQKYEAASFSLQQTSLYFTCIANGNSQMYRAADMQACIDAAGLQINREIDHIGLGHTLFICSSKRI